MSDDIKDEAGGLLDKVKDAASGAVDKVQDTIGSMMAQLRLR